MSKDLHRENAEKCLRAARMTSNDGDRMLLLTMAQEWLELAQRQEGCQQPEAGSQLGDLDGMPGPTHTPETR